MPPPKFNTLNYGNAFLSAAGAFPINPGQQPFVVKSFLFINYTNRVLFLHDQDANPTSSSARITIGPYNSQPVYDWNSVSLYIGSNTSTIQPTDYINIQLCDQFFAWPAAPVQPPFVLPAGAATEATLLAFKNANHTDLGTLHTDLGLVATQATLAQVKADLENGGLSAADWLANIRADLENGGLSAAAWLANIRGKLVSVADNGIGAMTPDQSTFWTEYHNPNVLNTQATCTKSAPGANKNLIVKEICASLANDSGATTVRQALELLDDSTAIAEWMPNVPGGAAYEVDRVTVSGLHTIISTNKAATLRFTAGNGIQAVQMSGYVFG